jgi:hypothetical protein
MPEIHAACLANIKDIMVDVTEQLIAEMPEDEEFLRSELAKAMAALDELEVIDG